MVNPQISLMIYGTRLNFSGWEPLIILNNPPFPPLANLGIAGLGENPTYYTLRIDQNYTQYTLVYNPKFIKANGKGRDGALKVSISIPKGYKLDGNNSPYNVLIDIQRALEQYALTPIVGKQRAFEFKATFPSDEVFSQVLDSFKLVETKMPHRPMSSTSNAVGLVLANDSILDTLFRDIQYPEFSPYMEIAIAQFGESDNLIRNLDIPRKAKYEVFANNKNITHLLTTYNHNYDDPIVIDTLSLYGYDKRAYEGETVKFTVNEALSGKCPGNVIRVDKEREIINVALNTPKQRKVSYKIILGGCNKPEVFNYLRAYVNQKDRAISASNTIELIGKELINPQHIISITADEKKYKLDGQIDVKETNIYVPIKEVPKPAPIPAPKPDPISVSKKNKVIEFKLILEDSSDIIDCTKRFPVKFYNDYISFTIRCQFSKGSKGYATDITIPATWGDDYYYVALRTDKVKIDFNHRNKKLISQNTSKVIISKNDTCELTWRDRISKSHKLVLRALTCLVILAIVVCASIWIYSKFLNKDTNPENPFETGYKAPPSNIDTINPEIIAQNIQEFKIRLHNEEISFDDIKEMDSWLTANNSKLDSINEGIQFKKRIEVYMKLISVIEDPEEISKMEKIREIAEGNNLIEDIHYKHLQRLWKLNNGDGQLANGKQVNAVNKKLKNSAQTFKTFKDLPSCDIATDNVGTLTNQNQAQNKQSGVQEQQDPTGDTNWGD